MMGSLQDLVIRNLGLMNSYNNQANKPAHRTTTRRAVDVLG